MATVQPTNAELATVAQFVQAAGLPVLVVDDYIRQMHDMEIATLSISGYGVRVAFRLGGVSSDRALAYQPVVRSLRLGRMTFVVEPVEDDSRDGVAVELGLVGRPPARTVTLSFGGRRLSATVIAVLSGYLRVLALFVLFMNLSRTLTAQLLRTAGKGFLRSVAVAVGAMPVLMAALIFLFATGDAWRLFSRLSNVRIAGAMAAFLIAALVILRVLVRSDLHTLLEPQRVEDVMRRATRSPARALVQRRVTPDCSRPGFWARRNITFVLTVGLLARVMAVGLVVAVGFVVAGMIVVSLPVTSDFMRDPAPSVLWRPSLFGHEMILSLGLIRVSLMLAAIAWLYFPAVTLQETRTRRRFANEALNGLWTAVAAFRYYRGAMRRPVEPDSAI